MILPLGMIKNISKLAFTSALGIFAIIYVVLTVAIETPFYISNYSKIKNETHLNEIVTYLNGLDLTQLSELKKIDKNENDLNIYDKAQIKNLTINDISNFNFSDLNLTLLDNSKFNGIKVEDVFDEKKFKKGLNLVDITVSFKQKEPMFFISISNIIYALTLQVNVLNVYSSFCNKFKLDKNGETKIELTKSQEKNLYLKGLKLIKSTLILTTILYLIIGIFGYLSVPYGTPQLIFNRYKLIKPDVAMNIGKVILFFALLFKLPVNFNSLKTFALAFFYKNNENSYNANYLFSIGFLVSTTIIAIFFSEIDNCITFLGGLTSVSVSFLFPFLLLLKTEYNEHLEKYKNIKDEKNSINEKKENLMEAKNIDLDKKNNDDSFTCKILLSILGKYPFEIFLFVLFASIGYLSCFAIIFK